jgi:signal transduction histidine kinase
VYFKDLAVRRAADAIESMAEAFAAVDHSWRVVLVNQRHEALFQRARRESIGASFWDLFAGQPEAPRFLGDIRQAARERRTIEFEEYYGPLGVWLEGRASPHEHGLDVFFRDVTARRRAESEPPESRRGDEVLGIVAHDLRNHLNTIRASSKVALVVSGMAKGADPRCERRAIETILRASERMERLIGDLLDASAIASGTLSIDTRPVSPFELLVEILEMHAAVCAERTIELTMACPQFLPEVRADFQRLLQVLGNLVGNAIKFTPRGGRIRVGATLEAGFVRFWVEDTGIGIPRERLPHVFDRFRLGRGPEERARPQEGIGLGLAICKAIVGAHGGRIWVDSDALEGASGTTVSFTMPLAASTNANLSARLGPFTDSTAVGASEKSC